MAMILRSTSLAISQIASMKDGAEKLRILNSRSEEELTWTEINMLLQQKKKDVKELAVFAEEVAKLNAAMKSRRAAKQSSRNTTAETQISMSASVSTGSSWSNLTVLDQFYELLF